MIGPAAPSDRLRLLEAELRQLREQVTSLSLARQFGGAIFAKGKLVTAISPGSSCTVELSGWNGSADVASGANVTAHDTLLRSATGPVGADAFLVKLPGRGNRWEIIGVKC